jgi:hypothetical protein
MQWQLGQNDAKDALEYAERVAKHELETIDRLHKRTLKSLSILVTLFSLFLTVLGWIGYDNLKAFATNVARREMESEVTRQVQEKLTKEHIDEIVNKQVRAYTKEELDSAIQKDLQSEPLVSEIRNAATLAANSAATKIVSARFADRHFTESQCRKFVTAVEAYDDLNGYPVLIGHNAIEANARDFSDEIQACIPRTKLVLLTTGGMGINARYVDGDAIFRDVNSANSPARHLQAAFKTAGVEMKIVSGPVSSGSPKGQRSSLDIWIGAKYVH